MYSWEIQNKLQKENYILTGEEYIDICKNSPQISRIKYNGFGDSYEMWTTDNYYWKFSLTRKGDNL